MIGEIDEEILREKAENYFKQVLSSVIKLPVARLMLKLLSRITGSILS